MWSAFHRAATPANHSALGTIVRFLTATASDLLWSNGRTAADVWPGADRVDAAAALKTLLEQRASR